jgi:hypothetical protein
MPVIDLAAQVNAAVADNPGRSPLADFAPWRRFFPDTMSLFFND